MNARCWLGHDWQPHPEFGRFNALRGALRPLVRRCGRCGRVESATATGRYQRKPHLEI